MFLLPSSQFRYSRLFATSRRDNWHNLIIGNDLPCSESTLIFHEDGTRPHYAHPARLCLHLTFSGKWIEMWKEKLKGNVPHFPVLSYKTRYNIYEKEW